MFLFLEYFYHGCFKSKLLDDLKIKSTDLSMVTRAELFGKNNLGTYHIPTACYKYCQFHQQSKLIAIVGHQCYCFSEKFSKDIDSNNNNKVDSFKCKHTISVENSAVVDYLHKNSGFHSYYCGSLQTGGALKCGGQYSETNSLVIANSHYQS